MDRAKQVGACTFYYSSKNSLKSCQHPHLETPTLALHCVPSIQVLSVYLLWQAHHRVCKSHRVISRNKTCTVTRTYIDGPSASLLVIINDQKKNVFNCMQADFQMSRLSKTSLRVLKNYFFGHIEEWFQTLKTTPKLFPRILDKNLSSNYKEIFQLFITFFDML